MSSHILVVDDEVKMGVLVAGTLEDEGFEVTRTDKGESAISLLKKKHFDVIITDLKMSPVGGLTVLQEAKKANADTIVILMTAHASVDTAVSAMKAGAADYLAKPFSLDEMVMLVKRQLESRRLQNQVQALQSELERYVPRDIIGASPSLQNVLTMVSKVAHTDASVLITGESGTGKELVARAIHAASARSKGAFVAINCAALPETLLESELFGHEKGSFTGANQRKRGRFELADGGTIFLDEVGEIATGIQAKLLRALEEHSFNRVGGTTVLSVDTRVVAATNRDLLAAMKDGRFREDLFFRLNVFPIHVPPLRDRGNDIVTLAGHFLKSLGAQAQLSADAEQALLRYEWPGNVRELRNVLERAVILADGDTIAAGDLHLLSMTGESRKEPIPSNEGIAEVEKQMILKALEDAGDNKAEAARLLKITRRMLYSRMKKHGMRG
jgi:two-component system NtrC family response regulator